MYIIKYRGGKVNAFAAGFSFFDKEIESAAPGL